MATTVRNCRITTVKLSVSLAAIAVAAYFTPVRSATVAQVQPPAQRLYGSITINGQNAPVGTLVEARTTSNVTCGETIGAGVYSGIQYYLDVNSAISSCATPGSAIVLYVDGLRADQTATIQSPLGSATQVNLSIENANPALVQYAPPPLPTLPARTPAPPPPLPTPYPPPTAPTGVSAAALDANDIQVDWGAGMGVVFGYELDDGESGATIVDVDRGARSFVLQGLQPETEYCVVVYSYNSSNYSPPSDTVCATTPSD